MWLAIDFPNISPEIFAIDIGTFHFALRWYAMGYIVGILIGWWIIGRALARPHLFAGGAPMTKQQLEELVTWMVIGIVLGGRLGFVLFYQPGYYLQNPGDILKVDIGLFHKGWVGDAAWTYAIAHASDTALKLMACGRESLAEGIKELAPGNTLLSWARTVQHIVEQKHGFHCVRRLGGHGIGFKKLHGKPWVSNVVPTFPGEWPEALNMCEAGMLLAVEPMIGAGTGDIKDHPRAWPIHTADASLAVHYEADVLITDNGPLDLTEGMSELPDIVGA